MRLNDGLAALPSRSKWRFFPWFVAAAMGTVMVVNFGMVYAALHTFPGNTGGDGFDLSNRYNLVLDRVALEAALGWGVRAEANAARNPILVLTDRSGQALSSDAVEATAERPVGDPRTTRVSFTQTSPGHYVGGATLDEPGQWELRLSVSADGHRFNTTRRIVVR